MQPSPLAKTDGTVKRDTKMVAQTEVQDNPMVVALDELVDMATEIVRETVRVHGNARAAIEPYTDTVKAMVAERLTHSEKRACGLVNDTEADAVEVLLRASAIKRERSFERRNAQTSRVGWRPRKTSRKRLAEDIAHSIREHEGRQVSDYTTDPELVAMVTQALGW